jgi:GTPase involved in cell partitioning and DNA repair
MTFALAISFTIHAFLLLWLIVISAQLHRAKEAEKKYDKFRREMEELFSSYLLEIKEENEVFISNLASLQTNKLNNSKQKVETNLHSNSKFINKYADYGLDKIDFDDDISDLLPDYKNLKSENLSKKRQNTKRLDLSFGNLGQTKVITKDELITQSLTAQALLLLQKGYTIEQIAKELNKGQTEIELLLKFRQ